MVVVLPGRMRGITQPSRDLIVFASDEWSTAFPDHNLSALATECSDHAPLLLRTDCAFPHFKRFRFENFWTKCEGYLQTVEQAWNAPLPWPQADAFRVLDYKLRATARALSSWSAKQVGSVRLQLAIAKEITLRLDCAQEPRTLAAHELALRRKAKLCSLGLASLQRSMVRQRSRITFLAAGDANTKFFHLQACHRSRKNHIASIQVQDVELTEDKDKADAFFRHFEAVLGSPGTRGASLNAFLDGQPSGISRQEPLVRKGYYSLSDGRQETIPVGNYCRVRFDQSTPDFATGHCQGLPTGKINRQELPVLLCQLNRQVKCTHRQEKQYNICL